jgi:hypothetical protein
LVEPTASRIAIRASASTAKELYETMLARYPDRVNPGSLWAAANAAKPAGQPYPDPTLAEIHRLDGIGKMADEFLDKIG